MEYLGLCGVAAVHRCYLRGSLCGMSAPRHLIALGWHAKPIFEQVGSLPGAPRVQLTHSSVQRLQFGWFCCAGISFGVVCGFVIDNGFGVASGGIGRSAATAAPHTMATAAITMRFNRSISRIRLPLRQLACCSDGNQPKWPDNHPAILVFQTEGKPPFYFQSTLVTS